LEPGVLDSGSLANPVQVVVFNDGDRSVGMIVDEIVDVVEEAVTIRRKASRKGLLGSGVVGKKVTDFLDLNQVIEAAKESWLNGADARASDRRILVADPSAFTRGMIRSGLDISGYAVLEAANMDEALYCLENQRVDVVLAALDLAPGAGSPMLAAMRRRPEWEKIPVLAVVDSAEEIQTSQWRAQGFKGCQPKFDSGAILEAVAKLVSARVLDELEFVGEVR
jgi:two-component system chemotaxis sensor kinase CheA